MINSYSVTITQINRRGVWVLKSHAECDNLEAAQARIDNAIAFYRSRGYGVAYRVTHQHAEVLSGEAK